MSEWINVKDRLPSEYEAVTGLFPEDGYCVGQVVFYEGRFCQDTFQAELYDSVPLGPLTMQPEYWQPLPKPTGTKPQS